MVPDTASELCLVRIANSEPDQGPGDVSDAVFTIVSPEPQIVVTSPNGSEALIVGDTYDITWTASVAITFVDIEYSLDSGGHWVLVASAEENDGSYTWTVPGTVSDLCLVRISDNDIDSAARDVSDGVFSIVSDEPPACGGSWLGAANAGGDIFNSVTYGGGKFVIVGNNGVIKSGTNVTSDN
jgi:hypothetical protein